MIVEKTVEEDEKEEGELSEDEDYPPAPQKKGKVQPSRQNAPLPTSKEEAHPPHAGQQATQRTPAKRKAVESPSGLAKRIRLEDYIPSDQIFDYRERDMRTVLLTNFHESVQLKDIEEICSGALTVNKGNWSAFRTVHAVYPSEEAYRSALERLKNTKLNGTTFSATCRGELAGGGKRPLSSFVLDVHCIPNGTPLRDVRALFPGAKVMPAGNRVSKLQFKSPTQLENAIKNPRCHSIGDTKLRFAYSYADTLDGADAKARAKKRAKAKKYRRAKAMREQNAAIGSKTPQSERAAKKAAASEKLPQCAAEKQTTLTPGGKKGKKGKDCKTPEKQTSFPRTPSPARSPKTFKPVGVDKSPLPKQKVQTPQETPKSPGGKKERKSLKVKASRKQSPVSSTRHRQGPQDIKASRHSGSLPAEPEISNPKAGSYGKT